VVNKSAELSEKEIVKKASESIAKIVLFIVLYIAVSAAVHYLITTFLPSYKIIVTDYEVYIQVLLALLFGYIIVSGVATFFYWSMRAKYDHPTAVAVRNVVRIVGIGAMVAAIAGGVAGGAAGVALGGLLGIVIGFASQQVLGQAIAGLFLLLARPFRIGDVAVIAGEDGVVEDVATLFTTVMKSDGVKVLIPNSIIIGSKVYLKPKQSK